MEEFEGKKGFPQVIGAIDGCHIPIICPKDDQEDYHNEKGFYSSILQGFVDSHLCFQREWDDKDWMEHFQMGQVTFNKLCTELEHYIVRRERKYKKLWKSLREKRGSPR